jgi:hypothetical protein
MKSIRNYVRGMKCYVKIGGNEMCKKKCEGNVKIIGKKVREMLEQ